MKNKGVFLTIALTILSLTASCSTIPEPVKTGTPEASIAAIPYYFIAIHNEPYNVPGGRQIIERDYITLTQIVDRANKYGAKLTLMFTAQWAEYISGSPDRLEALQSWAILGHEIAAHHHGIGHGNWDGYTDLTEQEARTIRIRLGKQSEPYLGTLEDYIVKLKKINPAIQAGCLNDEMDKRELADEIVCDTCSGFANFGEPGRPMFDAGDPLKGKNEYVTTGTYNGIPRKWLTHYQVTTPANLEKARAVFSSMQSGVYGAVVHSIAVQAESYYAYLEFLHGKDPSAKMSRTVSQIIEQRLLPEREIKISSNPATVLPAGNVRTK